MPAIKTVRGPGAFRVPRSRTPCFVQLILILLKRVDGPQWCTHILCTLAELLSQDVQDIDCTSSGTLLAKWHMMGTFKHHDPAFKLVFSSFSLRTVGVWKRPVRTKNVTCRICICQPAELTQAG